MENARKRDPRLWTTAGRGRGMCHSAAMRIDDFWALIEHSDGDGDDDRADLIVEHLAALPPEDIAGFARLLDGLRRRADTFHLWGAAWMICGGLCSDDGFFSFQAWLVGLGRDTFERVAADPDELAGVPAVRALAGRPPRDWDDDEWPSWEELDDVADRAFERVTGRGEAVDEVLAAEGVDLRASPDPDDADWDFRDTGERARRFPRLHELFPMDRTHAG